MSREEVCVGWVRWGVVRNGVDRIEVDITKQPHSNHTGDGTAMQADHLIDPEYRVANPELPILFS